MALVNPENVVAQASAFNALPVLRQLGLMIGLAASVALGVYVVLWSQTPDYSMLFGGLSDADAANVAEALEQSGIEYRVDSGSGAITVPARLVHEARLKLASKGLPGDTSAGFDLFQETSGFGTSRFMENARYNRAIEGELARSIEKIQTVESARVHLAIPKQSVFVRDKSKTRASVVLKLFSGMRMDEERISGIVHLVAASVPNLEAEQVTIVDHKGRLLTNSSSDTGIAASSSQLAYTRSLESLYIQRIKDMLVPIMGDGGVRAQVVANVDFTMVETTTESYKPDNKAIRSEETFSEKSGGAGVAGIPGALSNQPPAGGTTGDEEAVDTEAVTVNSSSRSTRNYELDHSVSHTRTAPGTVQRLSVAVVVDYREQTNEEGTVERVPVAGEEMERITALVKDAVGFDAKRNDTVNVSNISFKTMEEMEPLPGPAIWEQPWVWDIGKQVLGGLMVLLMVFGVLKPVLRSLVVKPEVAAGLPAGSASGQMGMIENQNSAGGQQGGPAMSQQEQSGMAKNMISQNPQQGAQVVKEWVAADG